MDYRHLREFFNADSLRKLAWYGVDQSHRELAQELGAFTPREFFGAAYEVLRRSYPIEYVLKNELLADLRSTHADQTYLRSEYWCHSNRADVVEIGDRCTAYEIKTKFDSPTTLQDQIKGYSKVFPYIVLVADSERYGRFWQYAPQYVGLYLVTRDGEVTKLKPPTKHIENLDAIQIARQMNKAERVSFVRRVDPSLGSTEALNLHHSEHLAAEMTPEEMSDHYRDQMRKCERPLRYLEFVPELPHCFVAALYDYSLTKRTIKRLAALMDEPIGIIHGS